ncbi:hypothetical protein TNCV_4608571 [Trichonephila clavipes]|nr:hypothetical protein TNCV_4608571 [Trichonephila clavipes]
MVGRHILEDTVGRVAQYVDEHYPVDKWHLGDLIAWVAQSALKYRPRICELSKSRRTPKDDRVPKKFSHCHKNCCMPLDNKCRITARCASRHVCGGHQH